MCYFLFLFLLPHPAGKKSQPDQISLSLAVQPTSPHSIGCDKAHLSLSLLYNSLVPYLLTCLDTSLGGRSGQLILRFHQLKAFIGSQRLEALTTSLTDLLFVIMYASRGGIIRSTLLFSAISQLTFNYSLHILSSTSFSHYFSPVFFLVQCEPRRENG